MAVLALSVSMFSAGILGRFYPQIYISEYAMNLDQKIFKDLRPNQGVGFSLDICNLGNKPGVIEYLQIKVVNNETSEEFDLIPGFTYTYDYNETVKGWQLSENFPPFPKPIYLDKKECSIINMYFIINYQKSMSPGIYKVLEAKARILEENKIRMIKINNLIVISDSDTDIQLRPSINAII